MQCLYNSKPPGIKVHGKPFETRHFPRPQSELEHRDPRCFESIASRRGEQPLRLIKRLVIWPRGSGLGAPPRNGRVARDHVATLGVGERHHEH